MNKGRVFIAAALAASAASAQAQGIEVKLSGQVNRGVMFVDDGLQSDSFHVGAKPGSVIDRVALSRHELRHMGERLGKRRRHW